jgi:hypothetical protein
VNAQGVALASCRSSTIQPRFASIDVLALAVEPPCLRRQEIPMTSLLFHLVLGAALLIPGGWFLRQGRTLLGWTLAILGTSIGLMGVIAPSVHRYLHH